MNNFIFLLFNSLTPYTIIGLIISILLKNKIIELSNYGYTILLVYFFVNTIILTLKLLANKNYTSNSVINNVLLILFSYMFFSLNTFAINNIEFMAMLLLLVIIILLYVTCYFIQLKKFNFKPKIYIKFTSICIELFIILSLLVYGKKSNISLIGFIASFVDIFIMIFVLELHLQLNKKFNMK